MWAKIIALLGEVNVLNKISKLNFCLDGAAAEKGRKVGWLVKTGARSGSNRTADSHIIRMGFGHRSTSTQKFVFYDFGEVNLVEQF